MKIRRVEYPVQSNFVTRIFSYVEWTGVQNGCDVSENQTS